MRRCVWIVVVLAMLVVPRPAGAEPGLLVGARDDGLKWRTGSTVAVARDLGLRALGITLSWQPGQIELTPLDAMLVNQAVVQGAGIRIVVSVFSPFGEAPLDERGRSEYCTYLSRLITGYPQINDVVIWNEPNLRFFWKPQFDLDGRSEAPARYVALLGHCWDVLHTLRPSVNIVAPAASTWGNDNPNAFSNVSHSPTSFIREMGAAYRASGRTRPIFDTFGHHPYPTRSNERPVGGTQRRADPVDRRPRPAAPAAAGGIRRDGAADPRQRGPDLVPGDGVPDPDRRGEAEPLHRRRELAWLGAGRRAGGSPGEAAGRQPRPRSGDPARGQPPDDVLPAAHRRGLQLPDPRRDRPHRVAVRPALGGRLPQGFLRRVPLDRERGARAARRLRQAQGGARRSWWPGHDGQEGRSGGDPLADEDHLPRRQARPVRVPAAACAADARTDGELDEGSPGSSCSSCSARPRTCA